MTEDSASKSNSSPPEELVPHQMDDKVFRATLQQKDAMTLLLTEFVSKSLHQYIDFDALELDNTEYVTKELKKLQSDVVWKSKFKDKDLRIILLLEHKKELKKELFVQLLLYLCCIWLYDVHEKRPFSTILPIVVHQGAGGQIWETRDFHSFFEEIPKEFLPYLPNFKFLLANVQLEPNAKILNLPEENVLRALFLMFKCGGDDAQIRQYFGEIFKFYKHQPHLLEIMQLYLVYLMASSNLSVDEIIALMEFSSPKSKKDIMTTYEVLVNKGEQQGIEKGRKLQLLQTIWDAHVLKMPIGSIAALFKMAPSMVKKWLTRFEWMREGEKDGLTPAEIMLKVNELAAEPAVTELEVTTLLAFFKEQPTPKTKKRRPKKDN
jgi:predicted transposase/invertase (TIGR01784 family)